MDLATILQIRNDVIREDNIQNGNPHIDPIGRAIRINGKIYNQIFIPSADSMDYSFIIASLRAYIATLDKTRIKSSKEYFDEVNNAPVNLYIGSRGYMPPEMYLSVDNRNQLIIDELVERPVARNRTLHSNSDPSECELSHLNLNDLISEMYLKYMYNPEQLHSCRHLIKRKINSGETMDTLSAKHLKQIDNDLYRLYIAKRVSYNPMTALGVKKSKSRKVQK